MHPLYLKFNSRRPLSWRFDRITSLLEARPKALPSDPRVDDKYICLGRRFLGKLLGTNDREEQADLFPKNPGLFLAYELYQDADQERAQFVQACILSGMSDEDAAERCGEMPATIDWYEAMFYNVRDRLNSRFWVTKNCLGPAAERFLDDHGRQFTTKMFGYFVGPKMLDMMISGFDPTKRWREMEDLSSVLDVHAADTIRRRSASSAMTVEINRFNVMELLGAHLKLMELAQSAKSNDEARTIIETNIDVMLKNLTWNAGEGPSAIGSRTGERYEGMGAELRADEMMRLGVGRDVDLPEDVIKLRIPEPRSADANAQQGR